MGTLCLRQGYAQAGKYDSNTLLALLERHCPFTDSCKEVVEEILQASAVAKDWELYFLTLSEQITHHTFFHQLNAAKTSLELFERELDKHSAEDGLRYYRAISAYYWGQYYFGLGAFEQAIPFFVETIEAIKQFEALTFEEENLLIYAHHETGNCYRRMGMYTEALAQYYAAIELLRTRRAPGLDRDPHIAILRKQIGEIQLLQNEPALAEQAYLQAKSELEALETRHPGRVRTELIAVMLALGKLYIHTREDEKALLSIRQSLPLMTKGSQFFATAYEKLGEIFLAESRYDSAQHYFELSLQTRGYSPASKRARFAPGLCSLGKVYAKMGQMDSCLNYYQMALHNLVPGFEATAWEETPRLEHILDPINLLACLQLKAEALATYARTPSLKPDMLRAAYASAKCAIALIDSIRIHFDSEIDRQFLIQNSYPVFELALSLATQLYHLSGDPQYIMQAYEAAEKSRAVNLYAAMREARVHSYAGLDREILEEERKLKAEYVAIQQRLLRYQHVEPEQYDYWLQRRKEADVAYRQFLANIKAFHPRYYHLKYDLAVVSSRDVHHQLRQADQGLIEYFWGDTSMYAIVFTPQTDTLIQFSLDFPLQQWIDSLRLGITAYHEAEANRQTQPLYLESAQWYIRYAHKLYQKVFQPIEQGVALPRRVTIVADKGLFYLPFSVLLDSMPTSATGFLTHPYLLHRYTFSYASAASMLYEAFEMPKPGKKSMLAMAPFDEEGITIAGPDGGRFVLDELETTRQELQQLHAAFGAETYYSHQATKKRFLALSPYRQIIHLSTHGVLTDSISPFLVFYPEAVNDSIPTNLLYLRELYANVIPCELVVLNACNTGGGRYQLGEGVQSLASGFSYAGVHSVIATLWPVKDAGKMLPLMEHFYGQLYAHTPKDIALTKGQSYYLSLQRFDPDAHPFYWSPYMFSGNVRALPASSHWWYYTGLLGLVLVVAAGAWMSRNRFYNGAGRRDRLRAQ